MISTILRNFFQEPAAMKVFHLWGWLCIVMMVCALLNPFYKALIEPFESDAPAAVEIAG